MQHFITTCQDCGATWDNDYDPPACECVESEWLLEVEERDE